MLVVNSMGLDLRVASAVGVVVGSLSLVVGYRFQGRWWIDAASDIEVLFPTAVEPPTPDQPSAGGHG